MTTDLVKYGPHVHENKTQCEVYTRITIFFNYEKRRQTHKSIILFLLADSQYSIYSMIKIIFISNLEYYYIKHEAGFAIDL